MNEDVSASAEIEVSVNPLIDVRPLFQRPGALLRRPDEKHVDADAFHFMDAARIQTVAFAFEAVTQNADLLHQSCPTAAAFESGAYLRWNDLSLQKGGLFDIAGDWAPAHSQHRKGSSIDINRSVIDAGTGQVVPIPPASCLQRVVRRACAEAHGHIVPEGPIHCELD